MYISCQIYHYDNILISGGAESPQPKINLGDEPQVTPILPPERAVVSEVSVRPVDPRVTGANLNLVLQDSDFCCHVILEDRKEHHFDIRNWKAFYVHFVNNLFVHYRIACSTSHASSTPSKCILHTAASLLLLNRFEICKTYRNTSSV